MTTGESTLLLRAIRYAAGELDPAVAESFENRLGGDSAAREALSEAVRLANRAANAVELKPDGLRKAAVAEKLFPNWLSRFLPRRPYRGHPIAWLILGGAVVGLATRNHSPEREAEVAAMPEVKPEMAAANPAVESFTEAETQIARTGEVPMTQVPVRRPVESNPAPPVANPNRGGLNPDPMLGDRIGNGEGDERG